MKVGEEDSPWFSRCACLMLDVKKVGQGKRRSSLGHEAVLVRGDDEWEEQGEANVKEFC